MHFIDDLQHTRRIYIVYICMSYISSKHVYLDNIQIKGKPCFLCKIRLWSQYNPDAWKALHSHEKSQLSDRCHFPKLQCISRGWSSIFATNRLFFFPYADDISSLLSAKVPAVDYKQPNKTQWQPSECLQLRVFGQPPVGDDITFSETGRKVRPKNGEGKQRNQVENMSWKTWSWNFESFFF